MPEKVAKDYEEQMSKPDLVFVTKANKKFLEERARELGKSLPEDKVKEIDQRWQCSDCKHVESVSLVQCSKCNTPRVKETAGRLCESCGEVVKGPHKCPGLLGEG